MAYGKYTHALKTNVYISLIKNVRIIVLKVRSDKVLLKLKVPTNSGLEESHTICYTTTAKQVFCILKLYQRCANFLTGVEKTDH